MALIGYARISTDDKNQKLDSQIDQLKAAGCVRIFQESHTGTWDDRPQWKACLDRLEPGDILVATELSRISRNSLMLMQLGKYFTDKNIELKTLNGFVVDTTTPMGRFFYTILAGLAQLERDILSERTKAGLISARARDRIGGRPRVLDPIKEGMLLESYKSGKYSIQQLMDTFKVSDSTIFRAARKAKVKPNLGPQPNIQPSINQLVLCGK